MNVRRKGEAGVSGGLREGRREAARGEEDEKGGKEKGGESAGCYRRDGRGRRSRGEGSLAEEEEKEEGYINL